MTIVYAVEKPLMSYDDENYEFEGYELHELYAKQADAEQAVKRVSFITKDWQDRPVTHEGRVREMTVR